jgi:glycosyltransferase involved in cell wall biosynthesis
LKAAGATLIRLPVDARNPVTILANGLRLKTLIRQEGVSLVHVRSRAPAFSALWAARTSRVPVVATYHGIYGARSRLKRWYNGVMTRGDLTLANSDFTHRHIVEQHAIDPERIVLAPEGIDTGTFDPTTVTPARIAALRSAWGLAADDTRPVILLAARLTGWKGQGVMIEALARLPPKLEPVLILAGKAETVGARAVLESAAAQLGLAERVRFPGPVSDMPAAYGAADLVVAPSTSPESFGRAVAEACAMARPVLASPLGATPETLIAGETGWFAAPGEPDAWAAEAARILALPPEVRARTGARARARIVAHYSLDAMAEAHFAIYRRLLEARA